VLVRGGYTPLFCLPRVLGLSEALGRSAIDTKELPLIDKFSIAGFTSLRSLFNVEDGTTILPNNARIDGADSNYTVSMLVCSLRFE
jgi:hypothetical protein